MNQEQRNANSIGFIYGDLIGWMIQFKVRPSEQVHILQALRDAKEWAVVCGVIRGMNREVFDVPPYRASDLKRSV